MDQLFKLIHGLKPGERRDFRSFANRFNRDPDYLALYDLLLATKKYNERRLIRDLGVTSEKFSYLKHQLKGSLFSFLEFSFQSVEKELSKSLFLAEELIRRNLLKLAIKELRKAIKVSKKREAFFFAEKIWLFGGQIPQFLDSPVHKEFAEWLKYTKEEYEEFNRLNTLMQSSLEQKKSRKIKISLTREILKTLKEKGCPSGIRAREKYFLATISGNIFIQNWQGAIASIWGYVENIEGNSKIFDDPVLLIVKQLRFLPIIYSQIWDENGRDYSILKLSSVRGKSEIQNAYIFGTTNISIFSVFIDQGDFPKLRDGFGDKMNTLEMFSPILETGIVVQLNFLFCVCAFFSNDYANARRCISNFYSLTSSSSTWSEYLPFFKTIEIFLDITQKEFERLFSNVASLERILENRNISYKYFGIIIDLAKAQILSASWENINWSGIFANIQTLTNDPFESRPFQYFDFTPWLNFLTKGQSPDMFIKERLEKKRKKHQESLSKSQIS